MTKKNIFWLLFLSLIFWPKKWIFHHFLHVSAILKVFLTEKKKMNQMKKFRLVHTFFNVASVFQFSVRKCLENWKKLPKKGHKSRVHIFTCCACTQVCAGSQTILNSLGDQILHMLKVWWSFDFIWPNNDMLKIWTKCDGQADKQASNQSTGQLPN